MGYLPCDGELYSRTLYPDLYDVIGHMYSNGQYFSRDTFRTPDLRGCAPMGWGGNLNGSFESEQIPNNFTSANTNGESWVISAFGGTGTDIWRTMDNNPATYGVLDAGGDAISGIRVTAGRIGSWRDNAKSVTQIRVQAANSALTADAKGIRVWGKVSDTSPYVLMHEDTEVIISRTALTTIELAEPFRSNDYVVDIGDSAGMDSAVAIYQLHFFGTYRLPGDSTPAMTRMPQAPFAASAADAGQHVHSMQNAGGHNHSIPGGRQGGSGGYTATDTSASALNTGWAGDHAHTINADGAHTHTITVSGGDVQNTVPGKLISWVIKT